MSDQRKLSVAMTRDEAFSLIVLLRQAGEDDFADRIEDALGLTIDAADAWEKTDEGEDER